MSNEYIHKDCKSSMSGTKLRTKGLILTYNCNLDCSYCYIPIKSKKVMPFEIAKETINTLFHSKDKEGNDYDRFEIQFLGAEPLTAFSRLKEIAEWIWQQNYEKPYILFATTNGTLLNDDMKEWFTFNKNRFVLCLSYDGTSKMQDRNRSFSSDKIDLDFFIRTWPEQTIKLTISEHSVTSLAEGIIYLTKKGFKINANVAYEDKDWTKRSILEYSNQLNQLIDYYINNPNAKRVSILNMDVRNLFKNNNIAQHKYCGAGEAYDITDVDGKRYPCHMFSPLVLIRTRLNHLNELDFYEQKNFADKRCASCLLKNICPTCAGMNYNITGNTQLRDRTHCQIFILDVMCNVKLQTKQLNNKIKNKEDISKEDKEMALAIREISDILKNQDRWK